ncbi:hypothetical protein HYY70_05325 [Candidatus Woesearchaeota archaeon]|nr:hypothetical protein [Candidatus Woesearchaeota archaeon]
MAVKEELSEKEIGCYYLELSLCLSILCVIILGLKIERFKYNVHNVIQMIVKDAMILIHLAKITLLKKSCEYFRNVVIPEAVCSEILLGKSKGYDDATLIMELVKNKKIKVRRMVRNNMIKRAEEFNIQGGEAQAVALYWAEKADYLATDDDNVRRKSILLGINVIGTLSIVMKLYKQKTISKEKFEESLNELRKIGWFGDVVIDKTLMEGLGWEKQ